MPLSNDPEVQRPVVQRPGRPNRPGGPRLLPWEQWFQASQPAVQAPAPAPAPQQGVNLANWLASLVPAGPSSSPQPAQTAIPTPHLDIQSLMEKNPPKLTGEQAELAQLQGLIPQADFNEIMASAEPPVQADLIQRKLFTVHYHMYAAKTYLKTHPAPKSLEEIPDHTIIVYGETAVPEIRDIN